MFKESAEKYLSIGWAPIPIKPKDKEPLLNWKPYQDRKPTSEEIREWGERWPEANIAIVTGRVSGIIVFDNDGLEAEAFVREQGGFPVTPQSKTSRGSHFFLKYPDHHNIRNSANKKLLLDVKGEGGYIVVPPSIHPSGVQYQWLPGLSPFEVELAGIRPWMEKYLVEHFNGDPGERVEIKSSPGDWEKAQRLISSNPRIMAHWLKPKPEDRSGHDWRLVNLCIEAGIRDTGTLYAIILNNPHGKAQSYKGGPSKYTQDLITRCLTQVGVETKAENRFPREAIQGVARNFADTYVKYLESPWSFWAFAFLTCFGNILADRLTLRSEIRPQPRLYTTILGESADDRKSECQKQTVAFFNDALPNEFFLTSGPGSAEGLAERIKKYPKTLLVYDEMKVFVSKALIESSVLLPCVNTLFDSNFYHSHTRGHSIEVDQGYLSILAASTLDTFSKMWTSTFTDIGFINRLWLVPDRGERRFSIPQNIDEHEKRELREELTSIFHAIPSRLTPLEVTPEAQELFDEWYVNTPRTIFTKRLDSYGHRLMILFCANENKTKVTGDIVQRVLALLEWQRKVREENDVVDAEGKIARMEEMIRRTLKRGPLARRDLQRKTNYNRAGLFVWNSALRNLQLEEVRYDPKKQVFILRTEFFT